MASSDPTSDRSLTSRGARTRLALVQAARTVFERDGYVDARITDIAEEAKVAAGTFYTHFDSKEEILAAVIETVSDSMIYPHLDGVADPGDIRARIEANNRAYLLAYRQNARLMALFEQLSQVDPQFRELRRKRAREFSRRNARTIERLQSEGRVDASIEPYPAAMALSGMVGRMAYSVFVLGERITFDVLLRTVTDLWINALGIDRSN